jgi:hypothetical protein
VIGYQNNPIVEGWVGEMSGWAIELVACKYRFTDITGTADQGIVWSRSGGRWLKRIIRLTHL